MDSTISKPGAPLAGEDYDEQWQRLDDFIRYNPGARHRRRLSLSLLKDFSFDTALDVGCGPGELMKLLHDKLAPDATLTGVDLSPDVISKNRVRMPWASFETLNIEEERLDRRFDLITCSEVVEHLGDRKLAFENLAAMLNPGGRLLITCPTGPVFQTERHFGHTTHPDLNELKALAKVNNLEIEKVITWGFPIYFGVKLVTNIDPNWSIKNFAQGDYSFFNKFVSVFLYYFSFFSFPLKRFSCQLFIRFRKV